MFTGIVEEVGSIKQIQQHANSCVLTIQAEKILSDVSLGDSIAVNGICLTVTSFTDTSFTVDVMPETMKSTSLSSLKVGSFVNLERAMPANGRFGGHFVTGHVDGIGKIVAKRPVENAVYYEITAPDSLLKYMILKGSVAVDGTSLTIFDLSSQSFTLSLIPHTLENTVLGKKSVGDIVNIECDMIGKYIEHFMKRETNEKSRTLTKRFLQENGFY